jgi:hypothetical protein
MAAFVCRFHTNVKDAYKFQGVGRNFSPQRVNYGVTKLLAKSGRFSNMIIHFYLQLRIRMRGAIPPLLRDFSYLAAFSLYMRYEFGC